MPGKEGKNAQESKEFHASEKSKEIPKARRRRLGFLEASESGIGLVGAPLILLMEMTGSRQMGAGGKRIIGGGSKNVFGEGFSGMFPPLNFPPPFAAL